MLVQDLPKPAERITLEKGETISRVLSEPPLGGFTLSKGGVIEAKVALDDKTGKTYTFRAIETGTTRVTFFSKDKKIIDVYEFDVPTGDRVLQLRNIIKKLARE